MLFRSLLVDTRARGWAIEDGEVTAGFASVAAAVLDHNGLPVAGLALTFESDAIADDERERLARAVVRTAAGLTRRLGGSPTPSR